MDLSLDLYWGILGDELTRRRNIERELYHQLLIYSKGCVVGQGWRAGAASRAERWES